MISLISTHIPWDGVRSTYAEATFIPQTPCFNCLMPQLPSVNSAICIGRRDSTPCTMTTSLQLKRRIKVANRS